MLHGCSVFVCFSYCAKVFVPCVPHIWICEACRSSSRVLLIPGVAEHHMELETTRVEPSLESNNSLSSRVDDHDETAKVRTIDMEEVVATSVIHQPLQPHTSPLGGEAHLYFSLTFFV